MRLYLAPGVSEETVFGTKTKSEIRDWQWFPVDELPLSKKEAVRPNCLAIRNWNSFFMVMPFVRLVYTYMLTLSLFKGWHCERETFYQVLFGDYVPSNFAP